MGLQNRSRRLILVLVLVALLAACVPIATPLPDPTTARPPDVVIGRGPEMVCSDAEQVRLQIQASRNLPAETPATWILWSEDGDQLGEATWPVRDGSIIVAFPNNAPLPPGAYTITLHWQDFDLGRHAFTVNGTSPSVTEMLVSRVPGGAEPSGATFTSDTRHLYVTYAYAGGCQGAPYWLTVKNEENIPVCRHDGVLAAITGTGSLPCYREDGAAFEAGTYRAEFAMLETVTRTVTFAIEAEPEAPAPTPSPTPQPVRCGPLFTAAGLTAQGEPFRELELFDWYTQVIYAGSQCDRLPAATPWRSAWYRQGELVREASGVYTGSPEGVVWDSLTGPSPRNPFLRSGTYTVTLEIGETAPMTAELRIFGLQRDADETP
jgi:hypothetical protein